MCEEFDYNLFVLFHLRGLGRDDLFSLEKQPDK